MNLLKAIRVGRAFTAIAAVEGEVTRDGQYNRLIEPGAIEFGGGPYPLLNGHDPSKVLGRVDRFGVLAMEPEDVQLRALLEGRLDSVDFQQVFVAHGHFTDAPDAVEVVDLIEGRFVTGVSVGAGQFDAVENDDDREVRFSRFQVVELSVVPLPAIGSTSIWLNDSTFQEVEPAKSLVASATPNVAPAQAFDLKTVAGRDLHRVTVENGIFAAYVYLHGSPHLGLGWQVPPVEPAGFTRFHNKSYRTAEGKTINTGLLAFRTGHAALPLGADAATAHYENTAAVAADVVLHDDGRGIVAVGPVRPGLSPAAVNEIRGSEISGDWRSDTQGRLRLRIGLLVNLGGYDSTEEQARDLALVFNGGNNRSLVASFAPRKGEETNPDETQTADAGLAGATPEVLDRIAVIERKLAALTKIV